MMRFAVTLFALIALASAVTLEELEANAENTFLVKFYDQEQGMEELNLLGFNSGVSKVSHLPNVGLSIVEATTAEDAFVLGESLSAMYNVEYAEKDSLVSIVGEADWWKNEEEDFDLPVPQEFDFEDAFDSQQTTCSNLQNGMKRIGVDKVSYLGNKDVRVCVIDTGTDYKHTNLKNTQWVNSVERSGRRGTDDDKNGFVDDFYGWRSDGSGSNDPIDRHGHGTHCTGVVAGDCKGQARGVAPKVTTIPCGFLTASGRGTLSGAVTCIEYSLAVKCQISSNSWGGGRMQQALIQAVEKAREAGQLFVAAAGNDRRDKDNGSPVLAGLTNSNVLIVAASGSTNDNPASFTAYGKKSVDLAAPGVNVISHVPGNRFRSMSGTSMACPHAAGLAALLLSKAMDSNKCPTPEQLIDIMCKSGDRLPSTWSSRPTRCGTRINVPKAMASLESKMGSFDNCDGGGGGGCKDKYTMCKDWAKAGYCRSYSKFMNDMCKDSCGKCNDCGDLKDKESGCQGWTQAGHCAGFPQWMKAMCARSCCQAK